MTGQVAYAGKISVHLYDTCPALLRWKHSEWDNGQIGRRLRELVEPGGADVCSICALVWEADNGGK